MAKRRRKAKSMTITAKYNRLARGLQFFGEDVATKKRATSKQLKELQKHYYKLRKQLKLEQPDLELPTIAQAAKYVEQQEQEQQLYPTPTATQEELEPLPYADDNDYTYEQNIRNAEDIINEFIDEMNTALHESVAAYGLHKPWLASQLEQIIIGLMQKFHEARAIKGDDFVAQYLQENLDYQRIHDMVYSDSSGRADAVDEIDQVLTSMMEAVSADI